jgi:hypothetical protein
MRFICDKAFEKIDVNGNGKLDLVELQLGVYEVYNLVNKRFPGWYVAHPGAWHRRMQTTRSAHRARAGFHS